jgi:hypothetical protein
MNTDLYAKTMLTIIAACLVGILLRTQPLPSVAHAAEPKPTPAPAEMRLVEIATNLPPIPVTLKGPNGEELRALKVLVANAEFPSPEVVPVFIMGTKSK